MKHFTQSKLLSLLLFICLMINTGETISQTASDYSFTHSANGYLTDMSVGTTQIINPNSNTTNNGSNSSLQNIGFTFKYMGNVFTQFGINSRGILRLGATVSGNTLNNNLNSTLSGHTNLIASFWAPISTASETGKVHFKVIGVEPSRVLVVEWLDMRISQITTTIDGTFQLRLYETSNKIEFVYGSMNIGEGSGNVTASIGFRTTGNTDNSLLSVTDINSPAVTTLAGSVNNQLINSSTAGSIAGLNSLADGQRVIYTFTPPCPECLPIPNPPSDLTFMNVGTTAMTLNWIAGNNASYYEVYRSTDGVNFNFETFATPTSANITGLSPNTNYTWRVFSVNMTGKSSSLQNSQSTTNSPVFVSGTKSIGPSGDYASLTSALNVIGLSGPTILELQPSYDPLSEYYPINISSLQGSSETNILTIRPATGVTGINYISDASQTFNIFGDNIIIDGRPGGVLDAGSTSEIIISNTSTTGNAIRFNSAPNNTIKYCKINGVNATTLGDGVIRVSGSGNDNLTIDNCEIDDGVTPPANLIYVGDVNSNNDSISVTNCKLFNYNISAILMNSDGNGYTISGNSIFRTLEVAGGRDGIRIQLSGTSIGHNITNNFIGGSDVNCGGSPSQWGNQFWGIALYGASASLIQDNTVQNLTAGSSLAYGIEDRGSNNIIIENIIGHNQNPNNIISGGSLTGVRSNSTSASLISNNLVANLTSTGTSGVFGITAFNTSGCNISNNNIHSLTSSSTSVNITDQGAIVGIGASVSFNGIISRNTINNMVNIPGGAGTANTSVLGIILPGSNTEAEALVTGNRIYDLRNQSSGTSPNIFGITGISGTGTIANNQVSITNGGSPSAMNIRGININVSGAENIWDVYYNSTKIGGSTFFGDLGSSAFYKQNTNTVNLKNNLFYNNRTGGTGGHYAVAFANNTNVTSDYNLFAAPSNVALWGATPYNFADYKTNSGLDGFSYSTDPATVTTTNLFVDATNGNLNINSGNDAAFYVNNKGIPIVGISGDFTDSTGVRNTLISEGTTDIGSDEFDYTGTIPDLTASGPPALNTTTTYSFAGRQLGSITWGSTGTVPTSISVKYHSGTNPPGILVGEYSKGYWDFTPTGGAGFTYDITLNYTPAILHNIANENNLKMAKYDGEPWLYFPDATVNTTNKTVTKTGLNSFSAFTLTSSDNPLPVELASFTASIDRRDVYLSWSTASEINNSGFDVERKAEGTEEWSRISFIDGNGTTSETKNYTFTDRGLNTGKYNYRLKQIDYNGNTEYFNLSNEVIIGVPDKYDLSQNYPNPFNPVTKINFDLPFDSKVTMKIFDITGREIATLVNNVQPAGYYTVTFDAKNIASGMYFYRIIAEGGNQQYVMTKKMVVLK